MGTLHARTRDYPTLRGEPVDQEVVLHRQTGGGGAPQSGVTEGAALSEAERGMAEMCAKFADVGKALYVSERGKKREAID